MAQSSSQEKAKLRAWCRRLRDDMGESARLTASASICQRIAEWSDFPTSGVVFTYLPMRGEVDLRPLIPALSDVRWAIPRVAEQPHSHLIFHLYDPGHLIRHRFGMLEPDPSLPVVEPEQAGLILAPGLAFTPGGYRLGYGGGFYDRLLSAPGHAPTLGACFQALLLDKIPHEGHDVPVDFLVTEDEGVMAAQGS
jgi:5-formyltetrahydrofolate cyclo-ligase